MPMPFTIATFLCLASALFSALVGGLVSTASFDFGSAAYPDTARVRQLASSVSRTDCLTECITVPLVTGVELWNGFVFASAFNPWLKCPFLPVHRHGSQAHGCGYASNPTAPRRSAGGAQPCSCRRSARIRSRADSVRHLPSRRHGRRAHDYRQTLPATRAQAGPAGRESTVRYPCLVREHLSIRLYD